MIEIAKVWTWLAVPADQYAALLQSQVNDAVVARTSGMIAGGRWCKVEWEVLTGRSVSRAPRFSRHSGVHQRSVTQRHNFSTSPHTLVRIQIIAQSNSPSHYTLTGGGP